MSTTGLTVQIGDVELPLTRNSLSVDDAVDERTVARFTLKDELLAHRFDRGQTVLIRRGGEPTVDDVNVTVNSSDITVDDTNATVDGDAESVTPGAPRLVFAGYVEEAELEEPASRVRFHNITAVDHHYLADKRLAAITYTGQTVNQIVVDLHNRYLRDEGILLGTIDEGPTVDLVAFSYVTVAAALTELAERAGYWWYVSPTKVLQFRQRESLTAPWTLTDSDVLRRPPPKLKRAAPDYRTTQFVRNVRDRTDLLAEAFRGDGDARSFTVGFDIAETPTVTVNGSPQSVGVRGVDDGVQWYWNKGDKTVSQDASETRLSTLDRLEVSYIGMFDAVIVSSDEDAIRDRQEVEGGTGRVEAVVNDRQIEGRTAAFELAAAKLAKFGVIGSTLQFTTRREGLRPGMLLTVDTDLFGLETDLLVVQVELTDLDAVDLRWRVTAVEGPHSESWSRFFARMFDVPEVLVWSENTADVPILTRLFEFEKTWTESDGTGLSGDGPSPFRLVYPANDLAVSDTLFPQIDPADRIKFVELTYGAGLKLRKQLTQTLGANTGEIVSTQYVGPNEANAAVVQLVEWFGGLGATAEVGSGVLVAAEMFGEPKTTAEAWSLVRTDTRDPAPDGWWLTGDVPEGVYG